MQKNFDNRSALGEVVCKSMTTPFFTCSGQLCGFLRHPVINGDRKDGGSGASEVENGGDKV